MLAPTNGDGCGSIAGTIAAADPDSALVGSSRASPTKRPPRRYPRLRRSMSARSSGLRDPDRIHIPWSERELHMGVVATRLSRRVVVEEAQNSLERIGWDWEGYNKLLRAAMLLEPPLETHQLQNAMLPAAQAYDLVFEVRKTCAPTVFGCQDFAKPAAWAVREVLVL